MRDLNRFKPSGVIVPMLTPFKGDSMEEVDFEGLDRLVDFLISNGVHGLMPLGTSGEFALLSKQEREDVVKRVVDRASRRVPVIAGVSEPATKNAVEHAIAAEKAGAEAIISTGPYYYKTNDEGLTLHYQILLDSVDLPLMIYNIPGYTGYNIPPKVVLKLSQKNPGRVVGVKFTTNDLELFLEYLRLLKDRVQILIGSDSLFFAALQMGAAGGVLGSANVLPKEVSMIYDLFSRGETETARELQEKIDGFTSVMVLGTYPAALKSALRSLKLDCGDVRPPLVPLSESDASEVRNSLKWKAQK